MELQVIVLSETTQTQKSIPFVSLPYIWHVFSFPVISRQPCVFPFTYGDVVYYSCISIHSDFDWCSLDQIFRGRWRYCTADDPPQCLFPFIFRDKLIFECTKEGYILDRSWCSLTFNYNKDRKWKQCSPLK
uniref:Fibronectin type-II domain-containing protein n=1 Tax=Prolemur simus TaxID=1328070 RepID=A0A8C9AV20_PROSS